MNNARQDFELLVSQDGTKIIQGSVYDATENPFKKDLDKLKTDGTPNFGTQGAAVVIVEFSDFECPFCQKEAKTLHDNLGRTGAEWRRAGPTIVPAVPPLLRHSCSCPLMPPS